MTEITTTGSLSAPVRHLDDRRITLEQLRTFVGIAAALDFQVASTELMRSQSAITQSLQKLEEILCCRLIDRRRGQVADLTEDGRRLLPMAQEILSRLSTAIDSFRQPELQGRIRLGVPDDFPLGNIATAVRRCMEINPSLRVEVTSALSSQVCEQYRQNEIDIIIYKKVAHATTPGTKAAATHDTSSDTILHRQPLGWVASQTIPPNLDGDIPLITFPEGCAYRAAAIAAIEKSGLGYFNAYRSASYHNIRRAISAGLGIGILPHNAIGSDHVLLHQPDILPSLPDIELVLTYDRSCSLFHQFVSQLLRNGDIAVPHAA
ncbi:LysR family transcriptional regulator [Thalassospira sp. MCCC 1A01428]|uniref:LysR family transcriptional regulator n=1 Tax=Thalassospira sp. MCCC 1A01428 TaxID=1470575 RepID=UPI000A1E469E|nr:LysR family transcriptional regulator [Thalassospira sp. MCCC 1A01428]